VEQVRRFNRTVMQRMAQLDDRGLARHRPLAEARLLYEIGPDGCEVRALRTRLGIDSDRASHLLSSLKADGMVELVAGGLDRRVRTARLTPAGLAERKAIEEASDALTESYLRQLNARQQKRLVDAMADVERLLTAAMVDMRPVDPAHPDARHCVRAYVAELNRRSDLGYDPSKGVSAEPQELRPPAGVFLVASLHQEPVGCGAVKHHEDAPSEIKRMWVAESVRGLGLGRRLLARLETEAIRSGATAARLETNGALTEAIGLYRAAGYREVPAFNDEPFAHHWFEKTLR
jgi:DNA-binding MarR family transcriptional regulator/N-acetylglutamate synthase-like GNAT family acetyltransferase